MELEIKLVAQGDEALDPAAVLVALRALGHVDAPKEQLLDAAYHDLPDGELRKARWLLRCRAEGDAWVATVKGPGPVVDGVRARVEVEVELDRIARSGDPLPPPLSASLDRGGISLERWPDRTFRSIVLRTSATVTLPGGTRAELAIDHGQVRAAGRTSPVRELELELVDGDPAALLDAAVALSERFDVRPGVRTKSGRGLLLMGLLGAPETAPADASSVELWEAFAELEERRVEQGDHLPVEHQRLARALGIGVERDAPGWTGALWQAMARAARG